LILSPVVLFLVSLNAAPPARAGSRAEELAQRLQLFCERLDQRRQDLHVPGLAIAVVRSNEVLLARGMGLRNVEDKLPVEADTRFAIGSTTKAFTSLLVATLVDEGRMSFEDPASRFLPYFKLQSETEAQKATIADLLSHRTGLNRTDLMWLDASASREDLIRNLAKVKPTRPFRAAFQYNNVQYLTAGHAAAAVAGKGWDDLLEERVLGPLEMTRTTTSHSQMASDLKAALGYDWSPGVLSWTRAELRNLETIGPAGSIYSTAEDMASWVRLQLARGSFEGRKIVSPENLEATWKPQIPAGGGVDYGMGWMLQTWNKHRVVQHGGNIFGFSAQVSMYPEDDLGYVLLTNLSATPLQSESIVLFAESMLGELKPSKVEAATEGEFRPGMALPEEDIEPYLGAFYLKQLDQEVTVLKQEARLALDIPGQGIVKLQWPDSKGRWVLEGIDAAFLTFEPARNGKVWTAFLSQQGVVFRLPRPEPEELPITIDELMELHLKAHGAGDHEFPDKILLHGTVEIPEQGLAGDAVLVADGDDRVRMTLDFGKFGKVENSVDGDRGRHSSMIRTRHDLGPAECAFIRLLHPRALVSDLRDFSEDVEVLRATTLNGRKAYLVRALASSGAPTVQLTLSADDGALVEQSAQNFLGVFEGLPTRVRYQDFEEVAGISLPMTWLAGNPLSGPITIRFADVKIDEQVPADELAFGS